VTTYYGPFGIFFEKHAFHVSGNQRRTPNYFDCLSAGVGVIISISRRTAGNNKAKAEVTNLNI